MGCKGSRGSLLKPEADRQEVRSKPLGMHDARGSVVHHDGILAAREQTKEVNTGVTQECGIVARASHYSSAWRRQCRRSLVTKAAYARSKREEFGKAHMTDDRLRCKQGTRSPPPHSHTLNSTSRDPWARWYRSSGLIRVLSGRRSAAPGRD